MDVFIIYWSFKHKNSCFHIGCALEPEPDKTQFSALITNGGTQTIILSSKSDCTPSLFCLQVFAPGYNSVNFNDTSPH